MGVKRLYSRRRIVFSCWSYQLYAGRCDSYETTFVEVADSLLVGALADAELFLYLVGRTLVVKTATAALGLKIAEQAG